MQVLAALPLREQSVAVAAGVARLVVGAGAAVVVHSARGLDMGRGSEVREWSGLGGRVVRVEGGQAGSAYERVAASSGSRSRADRVDR